MNDQMLALWTKLQAFEIDGEGRGSELSFERRLARENNWSVGFARRVIEEYKRFVLLARHAGHRVTPSDEVDQAWHLHLTYTRSYWERLCGEVLDRPLHHDPTKGGEREYAKFEDWYARTLESYRRIFGAEPPADIWPVGSDRFDPDRRFKRIDVASHFVVPKRRVWRMGLFGGAITMSTVLTGCALAQSGGARGAAGVVLVVAVIIFAVVVIGVIATVIKASLAGSKQPTARRARHSNTSDDGFLGGMLYGMHFGGGSGSQGQDVDRRDEASRESGSGGGDGTERDPDANADDASDSGSSGGSDSGGSDSGSSGCGSSGCGGGGD